MSSGRIWVRSSDFSSRYWVRSAGLAAKRVSGVALRPWRMEFVEDVVLPSGVFVAGGFLCVELVREDSGGCGHGVWCPLFRN